MANFMDREDQRAWLAACYKSANDFGTDLSTHNSAKLVADDGRYMGGDENRIPYGITRYQERLQRPEKYIFTEHAERNAIYQMAFHGFECAGATMVCPWAACADCARAIIASGLLTLVRHKQAMDLPCGDDWYTSIRYADIMLEEAGVEVIEYDGKIFDNNEVRNLHSGVLWYP